MNKKLLTVILLTSCVSALNASNKMLLPQEDSSDRKQTDQQSVSLPGNTSEAETKNLEGGDQTQTDRNTDLTYQNADQDDSIQPQTLREKYAALIEKDPQLAEILRQIDTRATAPKLESAHTFFSSTHPRQRLATQLHTELRFALDLLTSDLTKKAEALSQLHASMVKLRIGLWKLHLQRFKSPEGEALYRYDAFTLSHALDWCCTYTDHEETLPLYRESLIFNLLTDEWFGLKHPIANWTVETAWKKLTTREEGYFIKEHGITEDEVAGLLALIERI